MQQVSNYLSNQDEVQVCESSHVGPPLLPCQFPCAPGTRLNQILRDQVTTSDCDPNILYLHVCTKKRETLAIYNNTPTIAVRVQQDKDKVCM